MADNFLEKHYDDYQSRKAAWEKRKQLIKIKKQLEKTRQTDEVGTKADNDKQNTNIP
jgi:hypothetical protein